MTEEELTATVTDSPAATRRERRRSSPVIQIEGQKLPATAPQRGAESTHRSQEVEVSFSETNSSMGDGSNQPSVHQDQTTRLHLSKQALFSEDVGLMRTFSGMVGFLCLSLVVTIPFLGGSPVLRVVLWGGALFSIFTSIWVVVVLKDVARYDQRLLNVMAALSLLIAYAGVLYLGVHSPAALVILPGLFFVARSQTALAAWAMYLAAAGIQGILALLILSDTISDPGLITANTSDLHVRIIAQALVQLLYAGMFALARNGRTATLQAMDKVIEAESKAQEREAAFKEVRADLDRVLGAGGMGHYSDRMLGRYKTGGILGRGAMGEVYEAIHLDTGQLAAAKLLHPHVLARPSSVMRFMREAQAASALRSPHSVQILSASKPEEPIPYLIMERLRGHDLAHHLREVRRLSIEEIVTLVEQVGSVIDLASAQGIVHRDLKPQNLFLAEGTLGCAWKVLDFGASKLADNAGTLTQGRVIGTPAYMSPQQAKGQDVDGAADRYCLAAIVYRAMVGRTPFSGKDLPTTLFNVVYGTPPQPSVLADVDPIFDMILAIGMAKKPSQRFPDSKSFARALRHAGRSQIDDSLRRHAEKILDDHPWGMLPNQGD